MKKGRKPIKLQKLLLLFKDRTSYATGLTTDEIAEKLYGESTIHTKMKTRSIIHQLRKRISALMEEATGQKIRYTLYSCRPEISTENGIKIGEKKYYVMNDLVSLDRVNTFLKKIKAVISDSQEFVSQAVENIDKRIIPQVHVDKTAIKIIKKEAS